MSMLNIILKYGHINIALLRDQISNKCHKIPSIGTLTCFIDTFCLLKKKNKNKKSSKKLDPAKPPNIEEYLE